MQSLTDLISLSTPITVADIGAAMSEAPVYQGLLDRGLVRLIGFEPDATECARLNAHYGPPHRIFQYFLADGGEHTFHETNWNLTGSLFEPNQTLNECFNNLAELTVPKARHQVRTHRLDDVEGVDDLDFVKIDVQGAELMVFRNAPRLLTHCLLVQTEVAFAQQYKQQPYFAEVDSELRGHGFAFHTFHTFGSRAFKPLGPSDINEGLRQILWADAVYVRDWLRLDGLSEEKLRKYAVLAHDILTSYDLCHFVLAELGKRDGIDWTARYRELLGVAEAPR